MSALEDFAVDRIKALERKIEELMAEKELLERENALLRSKINERN